MWETSRGVGDFIEALRAAIATYADGFLTSAWNAASEWKSNETFDYTQASGYSI